MSTKSKLARLCNSENIADDLDDIKKSEVVQEILKEIKKDEESMSDWLKTADSIMELIDLRRDETSMPWRNAANIKLPLITTAIVQYASRAAEDFSQNGKVCKAKVIGEDPLGAKARLGRRRSTRLNWQIQEKIPNWFNGRDQLHYTAAAIGTVHTKTYYDPIKNLIRSDMVPYDQMIVNLGAIDVETAPRLTQLLYKTTTEIVENQRWGYYSEPEGWNPHQVAKDKDDSKAVQHELYECHCWLNLLDDDEQYYQPYVVTIHRATQQLLRIVTRFEESDVEYNDKGEIKCITPAQYFTKFDFLLDPAQKYFNLGLGSLLFDTNCTVNTLLNQLTNAGSASTLQGGWYDEQLRFPKGEHLLDPCEWVPVKNNPGGKLQDYILPFTYKDPSPVLFQLVTFLTESANTLAAITDVLTGDADTTNTSPNTLLQLQQQGLKVYSSVTKRLSRSQKQELEKIEILDAKYLNIQEYITLVSPTPMEMKEMFNKWGQLVDYTMPGFVSVVPVVDIGEATMTENKAKVTAGMQMMVMFAQAAQGAAAVFDLKVMARQAFDLGLEWPGDLNALIPPPQPQPNPEMLKLQMQAKQMDSDNAIQQQKLKIEGVKAQSQVEEKHAKALKYVSDIKTDNAQAKTSMAKNIMDHTIDRANVAVQAQKMNNEMQMHSNEMQMQGQQMRQDAKTNAISGPDQTLQPNSSNPSPKRQGIPDQTMMSLPNNHQVYREALRRGWRPAA